MASISVENVSFSYGKEDVLSSVSFHASGNEKIAILGSNGSGKSTLMKLLDGLLPLKRGDIKIDGRSVKDENIRAIRRKIGIVFQDPDSQFVSPVLEEDTAFGPENYNLSDIPSLVRNSLTLTGLYEARKRVPQTLSGGEKERAQLAGIVAVSPEIVILDESFSMLDECGKNEMKALVESIWKDSMILIITHSSDDALSSDRVILLSEGRIIADGDARSILSDYLLLERAGVRPPFAVRVRKALLDHGFDIPPVLTASELKGAIWNYR